jgi:hypothetical protein
MRFINPLREAEYKDIFQKDILDILDKRVKDPTERKNPQQLMSTAFSNLRLIKQVEKDYKSSLEDLAVTLLKQEYPVIEQMGVTIDAKITDNTIIPDKGDRYVELGDGGDEEIELDLDDVKKRRIINAITHGAAVRGSYSFNMIADELNMIDDRLVDSYNKVLQSTFGLYDFMKDMYSPEQLKSMAKSGGAVGSVKVVIPKDLTDPSQIKIIARGQAFPYLVHELVKGAYELTSLQGFTGKSRKYNRAVIGKTDTIENESDDLKFGQFIDEYIGTIIGNYVKDADDYKSALQLFLGRLYRLPSKDFISYISNCIKGELSSNQDRWTKENINDIIQNEI